MTRKAVNKDVEADVLVESRRRCCICFGLHRNLDVKTGQIAHLDKDNSNNSYENLAFLCFEHHDQYDSKTSQSKNFTITEVKKYRNELKEKFLTINEHEIEMVRIANKPIDDYKKDEIRKVLIEILTENGTISQYLPIAHKTGLSKNLIENYLIELAQENLIRIDRQKGSLKKTYSLTNSNENLIIDAFIETLGIKVIDEQRYIRKSQYEIDAIIQTTEDIFVIEVKLAKYLKTEEILSTIKRVERCRQEFHISKEAKNVLLIGVNGSIEKLSNSLIEIENMGVIVKFIEINR